MAYATKGYGSVDVAIAKESDGIRASKKKFTSILVQKAYFGT